MQLDALRRRVLRNVRDLAPAGDALEVGAIIINGTNIEQDVDELIEQAIELGREREQDGRGDRDRGPDRGNFPSVAIKPAISTERRTVG